MPESRSRQALMSSRSLVRGCGSSGCGFAAHSQRPRIAPARGGWRLVAPAALVRQSLSAVVGCSRQAQSKSKNIAVSPHQAARV